MKSSCYLIIIFSLLTINHLFSQNILSDDALKNSPYIFEGKVVKITPVKNQDQTLFVSYLIVVSNVLKENKEINIGDSVELISEWPEGWQLLNNGENGEIMADRPFHKNPPYMGLDLQLGTSGIFLGKEKDLVCSTIPSKGNFQMQSYCSISNCYFYIVTRSIIDESRKKSYQRTQVEGFDLIFYSINEFNSYLNKMKIGSLGNEEESIEFKKKDAGYLELKKNNEILYAKRTENNIKYQEYLIERINNNLKKNNEKTGEGITFNVLNEQITGTTIKYYEFDIFASGSTANTYLDNAAFVLQYNSVPFGTNIVANNNITITRATNYNTTTYIDPMDNVTDDATNAFRFGIGSDYQATSWNRHICRFRSC